MTDVAELRIQYLKDIISNSPVDNFHDIHILEDNDNMTLYVSFKVDW